MSWNLRSNDSNLVYFLCEKKAIHPNWIIFNAIFWCKSSTKSREQTFNTSKQKIDFLMGNQHRMRIKRKNWMRKKIFYSKMLFLPFMIMRLEIEIDKMTLFRFYIFFLRYSLLKISFICFKFIESYFYFL